MDTRSIVFIVGCLVVLIVVRSLRRLGGSMLKGRSRWTVLAVIAVCAACVALLASRLNSQAVADCLQGTTLDACSGARLTSK
jgi:purine-cytosine permease-like protein